MGYRERLISQSILDAIFHYVGEAHRTFLARILAFFSVFRLHLSRYRAELFKRLRTEIWEIDESEYRESFRSAKRRGQLVGVGDLGYSGSTFFTTPNSKFLIKSLPRKFEHEFFREVLLSPYAEHVISNPSSLLIRITDLLYTPTPTIGAFLGMAPSHHIIMENMLYGKESDSRGEDWETYDLKPIDYFYPERDLAGGMLAPESVKERLVDEFNDKMCVTTEQKQDLLDVLSKDTKILEEAEVVDYSLFLVRYPCPSSSPRTIPAIPAHSASPWRSGLPSRDEKWVYRVALLDFFWAKSALQAKFMTGLVESFNIIARKGPMSITADPKEYRQRFLSLVEEIVSDRDEASSSSA